MIFSLISNHQLSYELCTCIHAAMWLLCMAHEYIHVHGMGAPEVAGMCIPVLQVYSAVQCGAVHACVD